MAAQIEFECPIKPSIFYFAHMWMIDEIGPIGRTHFFEKKKTYSIRTVRAAFGIISCS